MPGVIRRDVPLQTRVLSFDSIERKAAEIVGVAQRRAVEMDQESRRAAQEAFESERRRGYAQGLEEGRLTGTEEMRAAAIAASNELRQEAKQDLDRLIGALSGALDKIDAERRRLLAEAETGLLEIAIAIGRRVCALSIYESPVPARALVKELLSGVGGRVSVELHVNPTEFDSLEATASGLLAAASRSSHVSIIPDPDVARGGARLVSGEGTIDATIQTQLERIAEALLAAPGSEARASTEQPAPDAQGGPAEPAHG